METLQYVALAVFAIMFIAICGYELHQSQKDSVQMGETLCSMTVVLELPDGVRKVESHYIKDQEHAQQLLNMYMFHMIVSAVVRDPADKKIIARMDKNGRLLGV